MPRRCSGGCFRRVGFANSWLQKSEQTIAVLEELAFGPGWRQIELIPLAMAQQKQSAGTEKRWQSVTVQEALGKGSRTAPHILVAKRRISHNEIKLPRRAGQLCDGHKGVLDPQFI